MRYRPNREIERINAEAAKLGLTYGQYVAQEHDKGKSIRSAINREKRKVGCQQKCDRFDHSDKLKLDGGNADAE